MIVLAEKNGVVNLQCGVTELQIMLQNILEKISETSAEVNDEGEDVVDSTILLLMLSSLEPVMKYALPYTQELFKELKAVAEQSQVSEESQVEGEELEGEDDLGDVEGSEEFDPEAFEDHSEGDVTDEYVEP